MSDSDNHPDTHTHTHTSYKVISVCRQVSLLNSRETFIKAGNNLQWLMMRRSTKNITALTLFLLVFCDVLTWVAQYIELRKMREAGGHCKTYSWQSLCEHLCLSGWGDGGGGVCGGEWCGGTVWRRTGGISGGGNEKCGSAWKVFFFFCGSEFVVFIHILLSFYLVVPLFGWFIGCC